MPILVAVVYRLSWPVYADPRVAGLCRSLTSTGGPRPNSTTGYIYLGGKQIAEIDSAAGLQYVHADALGSPVAHSNGGGTVINRARFEPYGYVAAGTKPSAGTSVIGFTGHVQDAETDLVYMQQRYYDPIAGRFLSVDPVVTDSNTGKGFGLYTYVDNNPYAHVDPDGRQQTAAQKQEQRCKEAVGNCELLGGEHANATKSGTVSVGTQISGINRAFYNNGEWDGSTNTTILAASVLSLAAGPWGTAPRMVTVGRWMSATEHELMLATNRVVESVTGTTHVAFPAEYSAFMKQAPVGSRFVTFSVPATAIKMTGENWASIIGPGSVQARFLAKKGISILEMPSAADIAWIATKIR